MANIVDRIMSIEKNRPDWLRGPYITSATHAFFTVIHFVPVGIVVYWLTGNPWTWLALSTTACIWYWIREYLEHGGKIPLKSKLKYRDGQYVERTFGQRWDSWFDVLWPTAALGMLYWVLLR